MERILRFILLGAFGALLVSGFQCASADLTTARNAMRKQDWAAAKTALTKVLATDPSNCDALVLLADVSTKQNDVPGMVDALRNLKTCTGITPKLASEVSGRLYNVWVGEYNEAIKLYNEANSTGDKSKYDECIKHLQTAYEVKPEFSDPLTLIGQAHEMRGDTNAAILAYRTWWEAESAGFDVAKTKGITLGMNRGALLKGMGTPLQTKIDSLPEAIVYKDRFDVGGRMLLVFAAAEGGNADAVVEGWTYAPASTISESEQWRSRMTSINPIKALAFTAYNRGNYEESLTWCNHVGAAKPLDTDLNPLRTELFARLGRTDQAVTELKNLIAKDPNNVTNRIQYAGILMNEDKFDEAIAEYNEVLRREPVNETALFNMAAVYKNRAVKAQNVERAKQQADRKYTPDESYMKDLGLSAEYFVKLRTIFKYRDDLTVLEQLANIYEVRREKKQVAEIIMELEALRERYANDRKYFEIMEGVYARNNMQDKAKEMEQILSKMK
ncbi:MAG: hypothetical protein FGM24_09800 [Candidatus Kapabacteria bacterium]|nr:hypothetical protein [Candidatus Kapabacteria bacterium]